jgi:hypothetical protein
MIFTVSWASTRTAPASRRSASGLGEDVGDVGAALDLLVQPLERAGAPDLLPVPGRERGERGHIAGGVQEHRFDLGELPAGHARDDLQLLADLGRAGLGEDGPDGRGDHLRGPFTDLGQDVAQEVKP